MGSEATVQETKYNFGQKVFAFLVLLDWLKKGEVVKMHFLRRDNDRFCTERERGSSSDLSDHTQQTKCFLQRVIHWLSDITLTMAF